DQEEIDKAIYKSVETFIKQSIPDIFSASILAPKRPDNKKEETPIYEKLAVNEVFIMIRHENGDFLVAENKDGNIEIKRISCKEVLKDE
ncbi:MAG: hypothetical protein ABH833_04335, partial [Parcubacteria group bacterium]